jgi:hypothetical protein
VLAANWCIEKEANAVLSTEMRLVNTPSPGELLRAIVFLRSEEQNYNDSLTANALHIQSEREPLKEIHVENEPPSFLKGIWDDR